MPKLKFTKLSIDHHVPFLSNKNARTRSHALLSVRVSQLYLSNSRLACRLYFTLTEVIGCGALLGRPLIQSPPLDVCCTLRLYTGVAAQHWRHTPRNGPLRAFP